MTPFARVIALLGSFCGAVVACAAESGSGDDASSAGPNDPCVPGHSLACTCEGGIPGAQVCDPDGIGYGDCVCAGADDGSGGGDADGDGGGGPGGDGGGDAGDGGGDSAGEGPGEDGGEEGGTMGDAGCGGQPGVPSWSCDIVPLLENSCGATLNGCHSREAYNAVVDKGCLNWVSYEDVPLGAVFNSDPDGDGPGQPGDATGCRDLPLYERVVNRSPWQCGAFFNDPQALLVKPGAPEESYMIQKIMGYSCDDGEVMPPPNQPIEITSEEIQMLSDWIAAGAPYDG